VAIVAGVVLFVRLLKENEKLAGREAELEGSGESGAEEGLEEYTLKVLILVEFC
jgi:hypothetical protein